MHIYPGAVTVSQNQRRRCYWIQHQRPDICDIYALSSRAKSWLVKCTYLKTSPSRTHTHTLLGLLLLPLFLAGALSFPFISAYTRKGSLQSATLSINKWKAEHLPLLCAVMLIFIRELLLLCLLQGASARQFRTGFGIRAQPTTQPPKQQLSDDRSKWMREFAMSRWIISNVSS